MASDEEDFTDGVDLPSDDEQEKHRAQLELADEIRAELGPFKLIIRDHIADWVAEHRRPVDLFPLPARPLSFSEQCAALVAVHDAQRESEPFWPRDFVPYSRKNSVGKSQWMANTIGKKAWGILIDQARSYVPRKNDPLNLVLGDVLTKLRQLYASWTVPRTLEVAFQRLIAELNNGIEQYHANGRYSNFPQVRQQIEEFVDALSQVPGAQMELRMRAAFVETRCDQGIGFEGARKIALQSYKGQPRKLTSSTLAIRSLRRPSPKPQFLTDVAEVRQDIETVLDDRILKLSPRSRDAFGDWREVCREVQRQAAPLEVDGCWQLFHTHQAGERAPTSDATAAKVILDTEIGGAALASIKAAADSLMALITESQQAIAASIRVAGLQVIKRSEPAAPSVEGGEASRPVTENDPQLLASWEQAGVGNCEPAEPAKDSHSKIPAGYLGGTDLADALGVHPSRRAAFFKLLERKRLKLGDDCWDQVRDPRRNAPQFIYRMDSSKLCDLAAAYTKPKPA